MTRPSDPEMADKPDPPLINTTPSALGSIWSELAGKYNFYLFTQHRSDAGKLIQNDDTE